jgi:hypothetical protein
MSDAPEDHFQFSESWHKAFQEDLKKWWQESEAKLRAEYPLRPSECFAPDDAFDEVPGEDNPWYINQYGDDYWATPPLEQHGEDECYDC